VTFFIIARFRTLYTYSIYVCVTSLARPRPRSKSIRSTPDRGRCSQKTHTSDFYIFAASSRESIEFRIFNLTYHPTHRRNNNIRLLTSPPPREFRIFRLEMRIILAVNDDFEFGSNEIKSSCSNTISSDASTFYSH